MRATWLLLCGAVALSAAQPFDALVAPPPLRFAPAPRAAAPAVSFNGEAFPSFAFGEGSPKISELLARACAKSRRRIDAALYSLTLPGVTDALIAARRRGVDVRVIVDEGHMRERRSRQLQRLLDAGLELRALAGHGPRGLMHNKFALFDDELLKTGSFNWTTAADDANYENALFRDSPELLAGFRGYWEWMWRQAQPVDPASKAALMPGLEDPPDPSPHGEASMASSEAVGAWPGAAAPPGCARSVAFAGRAFPACAFSPQGVVEAELVEAIGRSRRTIDVAMFSFYSQNLADALVAAKNRGVAVRVVLEPSQARQSPITRFLEQNGIAPRLLSGRGQGGVLHDKFGIFDDELLEDGSYNWTNNAAANNFENAVFSNDPADAAGFTAEFEMLFGSGATS